MGLSVFKNHTAAACHLIRCSLWAVFMHILERNILNLEEERILKVETLNQLFSASDISFWFIWVLINFCSTGYFFVPTGEKESLGSCLSSLMVAFLDAASTRMFSEALCVLFLKLCSFTTGNSREKTLSCSSAWLACVLRAQCVSLASEEKSCNCFLCLS